MMWVSPTQWAQTSLPGDSLTTQPLNKTLHFFQTRQTLIYFVILIAFSIGSRLHLEGIFKR